MTNLPQLAGAFVIYLSRGLSDYTGLQLNPPSFTFFKMIIKKLKFLDFVSMLISLQLIVTE